MEQFEDFDNEDFDNEDWYDISYHETYKQGSNKSNRKNKIKKSNNHKELNGNKLSSRYKLELSIKHGIIKYQRNIERKEKEIADDRLYYCSHCKKLDIQVCRCMYLEWCGANPDSQICIYNDYNCDYEYGFLDECCLYHYYFNEDHDSSKFLSKLELNYKGKKHIYKKYMPVQRSEIERITE